MVKNFNLVPKNTPHLYLWTKRGVARHCKSVGSEFAWTVFEVLEDTYFNQHIKPARTFPTPEEFRLAMAFNSVAAHADDPYMRKRLVVEAANLLFGEEVFPTDITPVMQMTLFK